MWRTTETWREACTVWLGSTRDLASSTAWSRPALLKRIPVQYLPPKLSAVPDVAGRSLYSLRTRIPCFVVCSAWRPQSAVAVNIQASDAHLSICTAHRRITGTASEVVSSRASPRSFPSALTCRAESWYPHNLT
ncbi:hypothetical protein PsYK624_130600 [Phanerochaete sordida]|uniref:Uncharacterized protein n=1 Tax=Phanerochaete sordida TaxID=48140 RepID=A0A9P3LJ36_9APHY|nr:hypothetical protein PsYK624_130600 [Phanerochaete sordida]